MIFCEIVCAEIPLNGRLHCNFLKYFLMIISMVSEANIVQHPWLNGVQNEDYVVEKYIDKALEIIKDAMQTSQKISIVVSDHII